MVDIFMCSISDALYSKLYFIGNTRYTILEVIWYRADSFCCSILLLKHGRCFFLNLSWRY